MSETRTGTCRFCQQRRIVDEDDLLRAVQEGIEPEKAADFVASQQCDCDDAQRERERQSRLEAAGMWAQNTFSKENGTLQAALCSIQCAFNGSVDYVTMKIGKKTHRFDTDSDGMIRIRTTFRDSNEETF